MVHNRSLPVLLALAGLSWTSSQALNPDMGLEMADRLAAVAGSRGAQAFSAALLVVAGTLLVVAATSVASTRRTGRGARLVRVGTVLLSLGGVWLAAGRGAFSLFMVRATDPTLPSGTGLAVMSAENGLEFVPLVLTLPALLLAPLLLGIGARRSGGATWLGPVLWLLGIVTFMVAEFTNKLGEVAGVATASAGLVVVGIALARTAPPATAVTGEGRATAAADRH